MNVYEGINNYISLHFYF